MYLSSSHPICSCGKPMKCVKNGVVFVTVDSDGEPASAWSCDLYKCPDCNVLGCNVQVLCGIGEEPFITRSNGDIVMAAARKAVQGKEEFIFMEKI